MIPMEWFSNTPLELPEVLTWVMLFAASIYYFRQRNSFDGVCFIAGSVVPLTIYTCGLVVALAMRMDVNYVREPEWVSWMRSFWVNDFFYFLSETCAFSLACLLLWQVGKMAGQVQRVERGPERPRLGSTQCSDQRSG